MEGHRAIRPIVVLVADDNPADQELTRRALGKSAVPVTTCFVEDGDEVLALLRREGAFADTNRWPRPDVILLDLHMPRTGGLDVLRAFRDDPRLPRVPVVVLTTSEDRRDIQNAYEAGANAYLVKPVAADRFSAVVADFERFWLRSEFIRRMPADGLGDEP